jgi:hypothetical protein
MKILAVLLVLVLSLSAERIYVEKGWNLRGSTDPIANVSDFTKSNLVKNIYVYRNGKYITGLNNINMLEPNEGFFVYVTSDGFLEYSSEKENEAKMMPTIDLTKASKDNLTKEQKYSLAFMWNEEKLARDLYLEVENKQTNRQMYNIGTKSETKHVSMVEDLVEKYNINILNLKDYSIKYTESELRALPAGKFGVDKIQTLYDALYAKGIKSKRDALEMACMVEVTDVNDLLEYIKIADDGKHKDLVDTFAMLRDGSYNHYWAFDSGLKQLGVEKGCCTLGVIDGVDYCQNDYPKKDVNNEKGQGRGQGRGRGQGF